MTALTAVAGNNQVRLSWEPPGNADEVEITGYLVRVEVSGEVRQLPAEQLATTVLGLRNGVAVEFAVAALTEGGSGPDVSAFATPASGVEGVVAGIIIGLEDGQTLGPAEEVPGEAGVNAVDLSVERTMNEDVALVSMSDAVSLDEAQAIANVLAADPAIAWAEPDQFLFPAAEPSIEPAAGPDDSRYTEQWSLWDAYGIGMGEGPQEVTSAYDPAAGAGTTVAVIDTGITAHPDLDPGIVPGYDFVSDVPELMTDRDGAETPFDGDGQPGWDGDPTDPGDWASGRPSSWHGTKVAGVIAARAGNSEGIVGVAPGASIAPIRALSWRGGLLSDITAAITWASGGAVEGASANANPAKVINMSFAVEATCSRALQSAIDSATERGSVLIAAAGNADQDVTGFAPANCSNVIAVGATGRDGLRASYSNYGAGIDVSAPGGLAVDGQDLLTTSNDGSTVPGGFSYGGAHGTSISAALVSGAAARLMAENPGQTAVDVRNSIVGRESVRSFSGGTCDADPSKSCGSGILQLVQIATGDLPGAPTNLAGTPIYLGVRLSYSPPAYTGTSAITRYELQRRCVGCVNWESAVVRGYSTGLRITASPFNTDLSPDWGAFDYRIAARNASGLGPWSESTVGGFIANTAFAGVRVTAPGGVDPMPNLVAGTPTPVRVIAIDTNGRTYTEFTGRVSVTAMNIQYGNWMGDITITSNGWAEGNITATGARDYLGRLDQHTIRTYYNTNQYYSPASSVFSISPGPATQLVTLLPGQSIRTGGTWERGIFGTATTRTAGSPFDVSVYAVDEYLNQTSATPTVALTSTDANASVTPASGALTSGARTFSVTAKTAGTATFTSTDQASSSPLTTHTTGSVTVNAGAATKLQVLLPGETAAPGTVTGKTGTPTAVSAGSSVAVTVRAVDDNWNLVTSASPTVGISSSSSSAVLPSDAALSSGVGAFTVTVKANDTPTFTATRVSGTPIVTAGSSAPLTVNPTVATRLQVLMPGETAAPGTVSGKTGTPTAATAGDSISIRVNAVDDYWNVVATASPTIAITSPATTAVIQSDRALTSGSETFSVLVRSAGSPTFTATDQASSSALISATSAAVTVGAGVVNRLQILLPGESAAPGTTSGKTGTPTGQNAGSAFFVTVNATDTYWNLVSTATPTVGLTSSDARATLPSAAALASGTRSFPVTLGTSGTQSISATDNAGSSPLTSSTSGGVSVGSGPAVGLEVVTQPVAGASGAVLSTQPVVRVVDAYGNTVANSTASVTVWAQGAGNVRGSVNGVDAVNGVVSFTNLAFLGPVGGSPGQLRFESAGLTSVVSGDVSVTGPGARSQLVELVQPLGGDVGELLLQQPVLRVADEYGNTVTDAPVVVSVWASGGVLGGPQASEGVGIVSVNGFVTFSGLTFAGSNSTDYTLTFRSSQVPTLTSSPFSPTGFGPATSLAMVTMPGAGASGAVLSTQPVVRVVDAYGNTVTNSTASVMVGASGGVLLGTVVKSATAGVVSFTDLAFAGLTSGSFELTFSSSGLTNAVSSSFAPSGPGVATRLVLATAPVAGAVGASLATQPVVQVQDSGGNVVTASNPSPIVRVSTSAGVISGPDSVGVAAAFGVATFGDLTYAGSNSTPATLTFSATGLTSATAPVTATGYGTPSRLEMVRQPVAGASGAELSTQPVVRVLDAYGNTVTNSTASVTVAVSGGGTLGGTQATEGVTTVNGVATFSNLTLAGLISGSYQMTFSSSGITGASSSQLSLAGHGTATTLTRQSADTQSAIAGSAVSTPPSVKVTDSAGNPVPGTEITFTITAGGGSRAPTSSVLTDSAGVATLTSWTLGVTSGANTLQAASTGLTGSPMTFTATGVAGPAQDLATTQSIAGAASGTAFTTQPRISIVDTHGNVITADSSTVVTASISSGASLMGTATATAASGVATFTDLGLTGVDGTSYTISFSATGLTPVTQSVTATTGPATKLVVSAAAAGATYGNVWSTQPVVQIQDSGGNVVTTDSTTTVTLSIAGQSISGTTTVTAANGVATFSGLSLTAAPATYALLYISSNNLLLATENPTVTLDRASQSINFGALSTKSFGASPFSVSASATSNLTVLFDSQTGGVCSVNGASITILSAGTCTIRASQPGNANYASAPVQDQSFTVQQLTPTFTWADTTVTFGAAPYTISAPTSSTPGSFTYSSASALVISVSGSTITVVGGGSSIITATFTPTNAVNYVTGETVTSTIQVDRASQSALNVISTQGTYGSPLTLASSGGSGAGGVSFAVTSAGTAGCSLAGSGSTLTATSAGTCVVTATKAQDADYNVASSTATTVTFQRASQAAVALLSTSGTYGSPVTLNATGGSGTGAMAFAVSSAGTAGCTLTGGGTTLTAASAGSCLVTATRDEDTNYQAASSTATTVTFDRASQTVTFGGLSDKTYGDAPFTVVAAVSSNLSVSIISTTTSVCTVSAVTVTIVGAGTCSLNAVQAGSMNYLPAVTVTQPFQVAQAAQASLTLSSPSSAAFGAQVPLTVSGGSGTGAVTYSVVSGGCTISSALLTVGAVGTSCQLEARKAADSNYLATTSTAQTVTVVRSGQTITFATNVSRSPVPNDEYTPVAVSTSDATNSATGIPVTLSIAAASSEVCTLAAGVVTFEALGVCVIEANADATANFTAAGLQTQSITVVPVPVPVPAPASAPAAEATVTTVSDLPITALIAAPPAVTLRPGQDMVLVGGVPVAITTSANPANTGLVLSGTDWDLSLAPVGTNGRPAPLGADGGLVLAPSGSMPLAATGYSANSSVFVYLMSTPILLGVLQVDANGAISGEIKLPDNLVLGAHTLQINGYSASGELRSISLGVSVVNETTSKQRWGTRVVFEYGSSNLTMRSKMSLMALVRQVQAQGNLAVGSRGTSRLAFTTTVAGALREEGRRPSDRVLAMRRATAVATFLRSRGLLGEVQTVTRITPVFNRATDRFVDVAIRAR